MCRVISNAYAFFSLFEKNSYFCPHIAKCANIAELANTAKFFWQKVSAILLLPSYIEKVSRVFFSSYSLVLLKNIFQIPFLLSYPNKVIT
jgi:hypothetical protein